MTGKALIDKIIMGINFMAVLGAVGLFIFTEIIDQKPAIDTENEIMMLEAGANADINIKLLKLDKLTVNILNKTTRLRFLDVEMHLRPFKNEYFEVLERNKSTIYDIVIDVAGRMRPQELSTLSGKILLEERIKKRVNRITAKPILQRVFYTKFVVN